MNMNKDEIIGLILSCPSSLRDNEWVDKMIDQLMIKTMREFLREQPSQLVPE